MENRMILTAAVALLSGGLTLAGCSGWSYSPAIPGAALSKPMNLASAQGTAPMSSATTFNQDLSTDYSDLATTMDRTPMTSSSGDWVDGDYFARKSLKAGKGETVLPDNNANRLIPLEVGYGFRTQLADGRTRLMTDLDGGARDRTPALAARAQTRYDCWDEQMERDWKIGMNGTCRAEFLAALDEMETGPKSGASTPPVLGYNVYFDFDKSNLSPEGRQTIATAVQAAGSDGVVRMMIVGKADLAGTDPYNMALSERRADSVRKALLADGMTSGRIDENWVGEREPPVPTANGTREALNRVVEISLR